MLIRMLFGLRNLAVLAALAVLCAALFTEPPCRALDGQTLRCGRERLRVYGVYAPPIDLPGGRDAKRRLDQHIRSGKLIIFRLERDMYGRSVGMVYVGGRLIHQSDVYVATPPEWLPFALVDD